MSSVWIRVGSTHDGFYGAPYLDQLLPLAHAAGVRVIGWDFPDLSDPSDDAGRLATAAGYRTPSGDQLDGVATDMESGNEGVVLTPRRAAVYMGELRQRVGGTLLAATVPRPTDYWLGSYPYATLARYVDAFAPQVYWSCTEPGAAVAEAVSRLARFGRPVHPVGQAYDMTDEGGRPGLPTGREVWRFLDVARRYGATGASLYTWSTVDAEELAAVGAYPWPR